MDPVMSGPHSAIEPVINRHLAFGWWMIVASVTLGIALETLHGFKIGFYLDASSETRRLLFTLAHAHGALFGLLHIAFATSLPRLRRLDEKARRFASRLLRAGTLLLPVGFLLGGTFATEGDPGLPVLLAPLGALLVLVAVFAIALGARSPKSTC